MWRGGAASLKWTAAVPLSFGMFAVPREDLVRVHASSGTTGKPTVVGYTAADIDTWATVMARSLFAAGGRPGDLLHNALLNARLWCPVLPASFPSANTWRFNS